MAQVFQLPFLKLLLVLTGIGAIAYLLICLSLFVWQTRLIFVPSPVVETTPAELGLSYEEVWLPIDQGSLAPPSDHPTSEAERLHGWWLPATSPALGVLLYLHGNGENIGANLEPARRFHQLGFSVLMIDYRGYGRSEGNFPSEAQVYEDAEAAWTYLVQQQGINPREIFLYGHSLGGAVAIDLATQHPEIAGMIVEGTFTSIREMVAQKKQYSLLPINLLLNQRFDSISKIKSLTMPLLLIHGTDDAVVPAKMTQALHDAATATKQLLLVPQAGHNDVANVAGSQYQQTIQQFVEEVYASRRIASPASGEV
ncbi:MAG: phospholipase [Cyanobacteria bacterium QH_8_48_120]|jgi:alpha-beta hydrolase superfamily lysophospholipase|nr:MAG: phospholipase [Cyanobacteria bacterium QH_1_48_107]PSO57104.1 MAG: phospholipase [Cyanobacteria bacterium QH_10_48_56]PSO60113.1 MAG: phospholipase [Cyanobacteria bacterium QH_7_48_89]PSO65594.1 MAG: phospholipase [Cyanobacteria bacterium QH_6_48_35]PSO67814.1 MAG: phospholipase [Cyanobacteria bacterium QS_1_48_34]PSO71057.1 MAG: phospholipase [Cyanobacteria bacterium QH_8_48_120]PSO76228.1 MAG: phospholipase [Cyanobacteria bacterium QH_3_48_40]PSO82194.1 MAG: phospholipase [Cyanobac